MCLRFGFPVRRTTAARRVLRSALLAAAQLVAGAAGGPRAAFSGERGAAAERSVAEWVEQLDDPNPDARRRAAYALGRMGPRSAAAVADLQRALGDAQLEVRWYAVDALGRIGPEAAGAQAAIVHSLQDPQNDPTMRAAAAQALGRIGPGARNALTALRESLGSAESLVRVAAAEAIWRIDRSDAALGVLGDELGGPDRAGSFAAAVSLCEMGADAGGALGELLAALGHPDPDVQRAAARALGALGDAALPGLRRAVTATDARTRAAAATAGGWIADDVRRRVLLNPRAGTEEFQRAAVGLYQHVLPLAVIAARDPQGEVREAGLRALARAGPPALPILLEWLTASDEDSRARARRGLVLIEHFLPAAEIPEGMVRINRRLLDRLIAALEHPDPATRRSGFRIFAALCIGPYGQAAEAALRKGLHDPDVVIRRSADTSLRRLRAAAAGPVTP